ncbi:DUF2141 domain-containing protein [Stakelama tenebrarum]|uniref:DUF2141 domain-containing protein n=1 Tax=Stakelama tenebrarum TaxID=2711215 RepID=A0A6G6Y248_9SPHN|nr:DUF2141 domain-containing protein [Sphingosinithalassobacter tenebrarum]QIG78980.1 DUF2141 domain-containing protein [Sphingosinithalassobacter tenebrarum]
MLRSLPFSRTLITLALIAPLPLLAPVAAPPAMAQPAGATLTIHFEGITRAEGKVMVAVFDADGWNGGAPVGVAMVDAAIGGVDATVSGLAPGRYAVRAFQDVDGDMKFGTNPFGMPIEPFGFSNDAIGAGGPPSFEDAAFTVGDSAVSQTITLR